MIENDSQYVGITEVYAMQAWLRSRLEGVYTVEFSEDAPTASVSGKRMVFPRPNAHMTRRDRIRMRGWGLHEYGHPKHQPDADALMHKKKINMVSPLGVIWNILLDVHSETMTSREWPGDLIALSEFGAVSGKDVCEKLVPALKKGDKKPDEQWLKISAVMAVMVEVEGSWNVGMRLGFRDLIDVLPKEVIKTRDDLIKRFDLYDRLLSGNKENAASLLVLAKEIHDFLFPPKGGKGPPSDDPNDSENDKEKQEEKESGEPSDEDEKGEKQEGEGEPEPDDGDDEDGEPDDGDSGDEDSDDEKDGDAAPEKDGTLKLTDLLYTEHYKKGEKGGDSAFGMTFDYSEFKESSVYVPCDPARIQVIDYEKGQS